MKNKQLIYGVIAILVALSILVTSINSYASVPQFPIVRSVNGRRLQLRLGEQRPRPLQQNDRLRSPNHFIQVPGNNRDWAGLVFLNRSGNLTEMQVSAGPTNRDSEFWYPCRAVGSFQLSWNRGGVEQPCRQGVQATRGRRNRISQLPSATNISLLENIKNVLKVQASASVGRYCSAVASSSGKFGWGSVTSDQPWDFLSPDDPCEQATKLCQSNSGSQCSVESLGEWDLEEPELVVSLVCNNNQVFNAKGNGSQVRTLLPQLAERANAQNASGCAISIYGSEDVVFAPDSTNETIVQTEDNGSDIAINIAKGTIFARSAKRPEGFRLSQGQRYVYAGVDRPDKIENIDVREIAASPGMQAFMNPDNWLRSLPSDPPLPPIIANQLTNQLGDLRTAFGGGQTPIDVSQSPVEQSPAEQSPAEQQPARQFQPSSSQSQSNSTANQTTGQKQLKTGTSYGDPHLITFDGFRYGFQTVGEFVLVKSKDGNFEVQVRQGAVPGRQLSLNTGVAMKVGNTRVAFYSKDFPDSNTSTPLRIDGKPTVIQGGSLSLPGGGSISQSGESDYMVQWPTGEQLRLHTIEVSGSQFMNITPAVPEQSGQYIGLLGNLNGNPADDLQTRSGKVIPSKSTYGRIGRTVGSLLPVRLPIDQIETAFFDQLYKQFGDSWRIGQNESLFDYAPGQTTATFTNRSFPNSYMTLGSLSANQLQAAEATCRQAGVQEILLEGCMFDVGITGEAGFAQAATNGIVNVIKDRAINEIQRRSPIRIPGF